MRTFLAFVKDSYREAINGWVLQGMMILVALFLLLVFSVSFRPLALDEQLNNQFWLWNQVFRSNPKFGSPQVGVENVSVSNPDTPWSSPGSFDLVVTCPSKKEFEQAKAARVPLGPFQVLRMPVTEGGVVDFLKMQKVYDGVQVTEVEAPKADPPKPDDGKLKDADKADDKPTGPVKLRYKVTTTGTLITDRLEWPNQVKVFFAVPTPLTLAPRSTAYVVQNYLVNGIGGWIISLIGVVITAGFIPNMLGKGALDLIVSKPVHRGTLLVCKYIGGLLFVLLITSFTVFGVWATIGLRTGIWSPNFLLAIPLLTAQFAILYAVSTLIGVLTRNALVAILATLVAWFLFFLVGKVNDGITNLEAVNAKVAEKAREGKMDMVDDDGKPLSADEAFARLDPNRPLWGFIPSASFPVFKGIHFITPRTFQLDARVGRVIAQGVLTERQQKEQGWDEPPKDTWGELFAVSGAFIVLMLGFASWRFMTRDG